MSPTIGRIVLYHSIAAAWPAIITNVGASSVDLTVFGLGEPATNIEDVQFCPDNESPTAEMASSGYWSWPPRVQ